MMDAIEELAKHEQDWDLLKATQESLREHMSKVKELEAKLAKQTALNKKADNARELGLDYEVEQEPVLYWHRKGEDDEKFIEPEAMNDFCPDCIPLYASPQKYCPSENNAAYEKGFVDGMAKQMHSSVDRAVNAMAKPWVGLTDEEQILIINNLVEDEDHTYLKLIDIVNKRLKEKNDATHT